MMFNVTETRTKTYQLRVIEADPAQAVGHQIGMQVGVLQSSFASPGRHATAEDIIAAIRADEQLKRAVIAALGFTVAG